jgi:hypothetical protein
MKVSIRNADIAREKAQLTELLHRHLNPLTDERRFEWLFLNGPAGPAEIWVATSDDTGEIIGSGAALPRRMFRRGEEVTGCVFADFWIDPGHRVLGPAVKLQRACLGAVDSGRFALAIDFPRQSMAAVYKRLNVPTAHAVVRMTRPLRLNRQLSQRLGNARAADLAARLANAVLRTRDAVLLRPRRFDVSLSPVDFGDEFTQLARALAGARELWVARTAEYLNWRFRDHFHLRFELLTARQHARLAGYAVLLERETSIDVVDLSWGTDRALLNDLLARTVQVARERDKDAVNVPMIDTAPAFADLANAGFHPRERQPFIVYEGSGRTSGVDVQSRSDWLFTAGDESD